MPPRHSADSLRITGLFWKPGQPTEKTISRETHFFISSHTSIRIFPPVLFFMLNHTYWQKVKAQS